MARLLEHAQPGSHQAVWGHIRRSERLAALIMSRWPAITQPQQWQVKHVRWALEHGLADRAPATRYHYYRTARVLATAMNRWADWAAYLNGPWCHLDGRSDSKPRGPGGRPPKRPGKH